MYMHTPNPHKHVQSICRPDGSDLLDHIGWGVQVQKPLVDPHLKPVPGVGTLTSR